MSRRAAIPSMVNAHSHAFQLELRGVGERPGLQLVDDAVGEEHLVLVTAGLDDYRVGKRAEEAGEQCGLARTSFALEVDDLWIAHLCRRESLGQDA